MSEGIHGLNDWCPLCKKQLKDNSQKTRWEHDKHYHPGYFTAQTGLRRDDFNNKEDLK